MGLIGTIIQLVLFILSTIFRKKLAALIQKLKLPKWVLFFLTAIPFIIVEEHINCGAYHCTSVIIPPTLTILMIFELLLLGGVKLFRSKTVLMPTVVFSILGVVFERFFGGLVGVPLIPAIVLFVIPWVAISYAWIAVVPLTVLSLDIGAKTGAVQQ